MVSRKQPLHLSLKRSSQSGSIILSALVLAVVVVIMVLSSTNYIRSRANQIFGATDKMGNRIVLDGLLAYTVNAVKQSWCFSNTWVQDTTCGLTHAKYAARLLLSDETISFIQTSGMAVPTGDLRLTEISQTVDLSTLPESHSIYQLTRPLRGKFTKVSFSIKRDDSAIATTKGKEVPLRIDIKVIAPAGVLYGDLEINSKVIVYPRELSYFALIVPRDLYLGSTSSVDGDVSFSNVTINTGKPGLRFESPVFVNGNFVLPPKANTTPMKNVTFVDKVVIADGMIKQDNNLFIPKDAGGDKSMFNYQLPSFAGLLGGFELDVNKDWGLDYLFNILPPQTGFTAFELCKLRQQASYDLNVTRDSQLFVKALSSNPNVATFTASLGQIDNFIEQEDGSSSREIKSSLSTVTNAGEYITYGSGPVIKAKMVFEGLLDPSTGLRKIVVNTFTLPRTGVLALYPIGNASGTPTVKITTSPHYVSSKPQHNQIDFKIEFLNPAALDIAAYNSNGVLVDGGVRFIAEAMDYAYIGSNNIRSAAAQNATMGPYKVNGATFSKSSGAFVLNTDALNVWYTNPLMKTDASYKVYDALQTPVTPEIDYYSLDAQCFKVPEGSEAYFTSFPSADWSTSFAKQAPHAWRFTVDTGFDKNGYFDGTFTFDSVNAGATPQWHIYSVIKNCVISSTATFVTGFYTCENLEIAARTAPLRIIGTFITKNIKIANEAYTAGIRWSTIYHPQAVYELRTAKILAKDKEGNAIDCDNLPPLWASNLGIPSTLRHYYCNPVSLRTADPFKWTTVDPDCGIAEGAVEVKCKKAATRFLIKEISRSKGL